MFRFSFSTVRLAFALACVGASLPIAAHWFGVLPDPQTELAERRREESEAITVFAASMLKGQQWSELQGILTLIVERNATIDSVGVRSANGRLTVRTPGHPEAIQDSATDSEISNYLSVPLSLNNRNWGAIEFAYSPNGATTRNAFTGNMVIDLVIFVFVFGIGVYTVFVARVSRMIEAPQGVPDRVRLALDTLTEGLLLIDEKGNIILANRAFAELIGVPQDSLDGKPAHELDWALEDNTPKSEMPWFRVRQIGTAVRDQVLVYRQSDTTTRILSVNAAPLETQRGKIGGCLASFRDISHMVRHREELEGMLTALQASHDEIQRKNLEVEILTTQDPLTGCLNRRSFFEKFSRLWSTTKSSQASLTCLMIDLDHFKTINDTHGHHVGDEILRAVAAIIKKHLCHSGLVCRYGGEEFCVVLPQTTVTEGAIQAEKIRIEIENIRIDTVADHQGTASIGLSDLSFAAANYHDLMNQAEAGLCVAKRMGRNRIITFEHGFEVELAHLREGKNKDETAENEIPYAAVSALLSTLTHRDAATAAHCRRVSETAVAFAKGLISDSMLEYLEIASLLHDIGKIGVPDEILLKPGELSETEWGIMKQYKRIGTEIVAETFGCDRLTEILRLQQHSFKDHGYLSQHTHSEQLMLASGILAICDSFDAMTSERLHRKRATRQEAIEELQSAAGTQFDPRLVEQFVEFVETNLSFDEDPGQQLSNEAIVQLAKQIDQVLRAVNSQDIEAVTSFANQLLKTAEHLGVEDISQLANEMYAKCHEEEPEWIELVTLTQELVGICQSVQEDRLTVTSIDAEDNYGASSV